MRQEGVLGTTALASDEKNRVILPAKFRDALADGLVMTKGQDRCLVVWTREVPPSPRTPPIAPARRPTRRSAPPACSSPAPTTTPPTARAASSSRLPLRRYAGLAKDCVVVGADTRIEIWDAEAWDAYLSRNGRGFAELDGEVVPKA